MSSLGTRHPSDDQLLHFADGEMAAPEREDIRGHLQACWQCRKELDEIERTIGECVRYGQIVLGTCLPSPPEPWFDIYPRLTAIDEAQRHQRWMSRVLEPLAAVWRNPRRWIPAAATIVLIAVAVQQLRRAPSVQAAELLRKAAAAAESRPRTSRRIQIRTRTQYLTRVVGSSGIAAGTNTGSDSMAAFESLFRAAHYSWEDPLSAKSYAEWRDQLSDKRDEVTQDRNLYQLRTTTDSGDLAEASLTLSAVDLHTVQETLQFRNREFVEITELPDASLPSQELSQRAAGILPAHSSEFGVTPESPVVMAAPGDELAVLATLHRLGADLGDPVAVTRLGGDILVTGTGIGIERQQEIRQELSAIPRVTVRLSAEPSAEGSGLEFSPSHISVVAGSGPLQAAIEQRLGGRAAFEQFADQVFDTADRFMSRAHALRRLAQSFPPEIEAQLTSRERQILEGLRREHTEALLENVNDVAERIRSALGIPLENVQPDRISGTWQDATAQLFVEARQSETTLVALLAGAPEEAQSSALPAQVAAALAQLQKRAEIYQQLALGQ